MINLAVFAIAASFSSGARAPETPSSVTYFDHERVAAAFTKGGVLFGGQAGGNYKVLTARRDQPGEVEIHDLDTDIIYVVSGSATFITGGTAVGAKPTEPNEIRGKSIQGGTAHHLTQGDVIIISRGVPHWFSDVSAPYLYFVVKVR